MRAPSPTALRLVAITCALSVGVVTVVAIGAGVAFGDDVQRWRHVSFPRVPETAGETVSIFLHNGRILLQAIGAALAVNSPWLASAGRTVAPGSVWKGTRAFCDFVVMLAVARNLITVGLSLAAYRERTVLAILPHAPVELAAFACGLALYALARRGPVDRKDWLVLCGAGGILLALAAPLEVFVVF